MSHTQPSPSFHDVLDMIRSGELSTELDEQIAETVKAVQATGKAGELTLKIKIKKSKSDQIEISDAVICKMPQPERKVTYVFALELKNRLMIESIASYFDIPSEQVERDIDDRLNDILKRSAGSPS